MTLSTPTEHQQLHQIVTKQLRAAILNGDLQPGQWLRQKKLAEEYGVSQMPVREALKELAAEGLIEHIPYRGVRVVGFSKEDIQDVYENRGFLESRAIGFVARLISTEDIEKIKVIQHDLETNNEPNQILKYRELNREFHQTIYRLSGRDYIIRTLDQMWATFPTMLVGNFLKTSRMPILTRKETDIHEHQKIIAALENHDINQAQTAIGLHIHSVCKDLLRTLDESGPSA